MKNFKYHISFLAILLILMPLVSCGEDDNNQEYIDGFAGCCSDEPVYGDNVDNLDQSQGEIVVSDIITPNNDGTNDYFWVANIENHPNHTVTIYNSEDEIIFESNNYLGSFGSTDNLFPNGEQTQSGITTYADGTYKYKIVIENEQMFYKSGNFCLFTNDPPVEQQNFSECLDEGEFDQILTGF